MGIKKNGREKESGIVPVCADSPHDCLVNLFNRLGMKDRWKSTMLVCESGIVPVWADLPHDCLVNIFNRLGMKDRWRSTMFVCKSGIVPVCADLPHDCLVNIFNRLGMKDRWRSAMFVCKSWHHACKVHNVFDLETFYKWTPRSNNLLQSVVKWSGGCLIEIRVRHCSSHLLLLIAERCPNLEVLAIKSSENVTDETMVKVSSGCPKLKEIDISYCKKISHTSLEILGKRCANILILKRNGCIKDGDLGAGAIGKFMPQLLYLELKFSTLSDRGLEMICKGCPKIEYLDLSWCKDLACSRILTSADELKNLKNVIVDNTDYRCG